MSQVFIQIAGHLGKDPETRFTPSGQKVSSMNVATTLRRGGKEKTIWWKVTMWGDRFDRRLTYLKKGSAVVVWGEMAIPEQYQDREGNTQTNYEIVAEYVGFSPFGNKGEKGAGQGDEEQAAPHAAAASQYGVKAGTGAVAGAGAGVSSQFGDDDIPF